MSDGRRSTNAAGDGGPPSLRIAHVIPYAWEDEHEVTVAVRELTAALAEAGHRVLVVAPTRSAALLAESRAALRSGEVLPPARTDGHGSLRVLGLGDLLAFGRRGRSHTLPLDIARPVQELLEGIDLDVLHVHEPFLASAASVALRHSRALNVGTFHLPTERLLSTQVARRHTERLLGRLDARTVLYDATAQLVARSFPGQYETLGPGFTPPIGRADRLELTGTPQELDATVAPARADLTDTPVRILLSDGEERGALRTAIRALRALPESLDWEATLLVTGGGAPVGALRSSLRSRVRVLSRGEHDESALLREADVVVAASVGTAPAPGLLLEAIAAGAVPVASRIPVYDEVLRGGELGPLFEPGDVEVLTAQLERLVRDVDHRRTLRDAGTRAVAARPWETVARETESLYRRVLGRRHRPDGDPEIARRLADRPFIEVDLHMHTDHSGDCATPVDVLLATARDRGLGAIAVTDHNVISGALEAAAKAEHYGVRVIVGEEVMTADQGEVIGLFLTEEIPRGMTLQQTVAEIRRQGGIVYVPHPFDRMHSVPDYENLLAVVDDVDAIEVFNPRVAIPAYNEEAARFAAKYRVVAGAGSDSHVAQGLGSVRNRMRAFDGPQEFLHSLREAEIGIGRPGLVYVQTLKFLQTTATPEPVGRVVRQRKVRRAIAGREPGTPPRN